MNPELTQAWLDRILYAVSWRQDMRIPVQEIRLAPDLYRALRQVNSAAEVAVRPESGQPESLFGCSVVEELSLDERELMFEVVSGDV